MSKVTLTEQNGLKNELADDHNMEAEIEKLKQNTKEQDKEISDLKELLAKAMKERSYVNRVKFIGCKFVI
jgi:hypothetical protein